MTQRSSFQPVMVHEMDHNRMSSNLFKNTSAGAGSQKESAYNQSGFIEEIQRQMFGSIILSNGQKSSQKSSKELPKDFSSPHIIQSKNKQQSYNPNFKGDTSFDFEKDDQMKREPGSQAQKNFAQKRLSLYHQRNSGIQDNTGSKKSSRLSPSFTKNIFAQFTRRESNQGSQKEETNVHKKMFSQQRQSSARGYNNFDAQESAEAPNVYNNQDQDHIVCVPCSPEKSKSKHKDTEIPQTPSGRKSNHSGKQSLSANRELTQLKPPMDPATKLLNQTNHQSAKDLESMKKPNTSDIQLKKKASDLQPIEKISKKSKSNSYYKEYLKNKIYPFSKKKSSENVAKSDKSADEVTVVRQLDKKLSLRQASSAESDNSPKKSYEYKSPVPYRDLNQKMFSYTDMNHGRATDPARGNMEFEENNRCGSPLGDYQGYIQNQEYGQQDNHQIMMVKNFPNLNASPSRISKLSSIDGTYSNKPGPIRHLSKPIERPLSRQKESPRSPRKLLIAKQESDESGTQITRKKSHKLQEITSPDLIVADESEELSMSESTQNKSRLLGDQLKKIYFNEEQKNQAEMYPPEFGRPSELSSVVLDETECVPRSVLISQDMQIKQLFENTSRNVNQINQGPGQLGKLTYRDTFNDKTENRIKFPINNLQKCQSQAFQSRKMRGLRDGDENVRESIVERNETPRDNLINKIQSSNHRFSSEAINNEYESRELMPTFTQKDLYSKQMSNVREINDQLLSISESRESDKPIENQNFISQDQQFLSSKLELNSDVESNKSVDRQLEIGNDMPFNQSRDKDDEEVAEMKEKKYQSKSELTHVAKVGNNMKSQRYLGSKLNDDVQGLDKSPSNQLRKIGGGAESMKYIGYQNFFNAKNKGTYSVMVDQRSHNDPGVFSAGNIVMNQPAPSQVDQNENQLFIERQSTMTMPRRGRITLKHPKTNQATHLFESQIQPTSNDKIDDEYTLKAISGFNEGRSLNTNVHPDHMYNLQNSIVGGQYLYKQSVSNQYSEIGELPQQNEIIVQQHKKTGQSKSILGFNYQNLKSVQKFFVKKKTQNNNSKNKRPDKSVHEYEEDEAKVQEIQQADGPDTANSFIEKADLEITYINAQKEKIASAQAQPNKSNQQVPTSSSATQQLQNPTAFNRQPKQESPREYILTSIPSLTEPDQSIVYHSGVISGQSPPYLKEHLQSTLKSGQLPKFSPTSIDNQHKRFTTLLQVDEDNESHNLDKVDHQQISRATKGTIFQSSIKFKENIEFDDDGPKRIGGNGLEDSFINPSSDKKLFNKPSDQLNLTANEDFGQRKFENTLDIKNYGKSADQQSKNLLQQFQTHSNDHHNNSILIDFDNEDEDDDEEAALNLYKNQGFQHHKSYSPVPELDMPNYLKTKHDRMMSEVHEDQNDSPSKVQQVHDQLLQNVLNPKNNRHSMYGNWILPYNKEALNNQINLFIQNEIDDMKQHSNIINKLSLLHKQQIKPNSRLFEQFYLVGAGNVKIDREMESGMAMGKPHQPRTEQPEWCEYRGPTFHYMYPQVAELRQVRIRSKTIADFVFPNGVKCIPITSDNVQMALDEVLFQIPLNRSEAFIITLDGRMVNQEHMSIDEIIPGHLNCLCIKLKTFIQGPQENQFYLTEQALCMLACNQYFNAQFEVIDKFLEFLRIIQRVKYMQLISSLQPHSALQQITTLKVFNNSLLIETELELQGYIQQIYQTNLNQEQPDEEIGPIGLQLKLELAIPSTILHEQDGIQVAPINFQFPTDKMSLNSMSLKWHMPTLLASVLDTRTIFKLLTGVLLEKSIIVVSADQAKTSSVILGLIEMMQPFQWQGIQIPVLPEALLDTLDVPVPIIVGITQSSFEKLDELYNLSQTFVDSMTWVFLDYCSKDQNNMAQLQWRPLNRDVLWSCEEGQITEEEQDWFLKYPELRVLEQLHRKFLRSSINQSSESMISGHNNSVQIDDDNLCVEMTDEQIELVDEFHTQFQKMFYLQILGVIDQAIHRVSSQDLKNMSTNEVYQWFTKQIVLDSDLSRQQSDLQPNNYNKLDKISNIYSKSPLTQRNPTSRDNSLLQIPSQNENILPQTEEQIEMLVQRMMDPSQSIGFRCSFKNMQSYEQYCDNVIQHLTIGREVWSQLNVDADK